MYLIWGSTRSLGLDVQEPGRWTWFLEPCGVLCANSLQLSPILCQVLSSMRFSRQEYWSGLPCPPPGDLPYPGMEPPSLMSPPLAGGFFTISATWEEPCRGSLILHFSALLPLGTLAGSHGDITTAINMAMILPTSAFPYPDFRMK